MKGTEIEGNLFLPSILEKLGWKKQGRRRA